ncbi:hypothetical protein [Candidatus Poriferisodalis sp.]
MRASGPEIELASERLSGTRLARIGAVVFVAVGVITIITAAR